MRKILQILEYVERLTIPLNWVAMSIMLPLMSIVVTLGVFMRYIVGRPIIGGEEVTGLFLLMVVFFSLAHCWIEGGHIRTELVISLFPRRVQKIANAGSTAPTPNHAYVWNTTHTSAPTKANIWKRKMMRWSAYPRRDFHP